MKRGFLGGEWHPWRRYFARMVDMAVLGGPVALVVLALLGAFTYLPVDLVANNDLLLAAALMVATIPLEAVSLAATGSTPGKWLFGVSVRDREGNRLSFGAALKRSVLVFFSGLGAGIPIISLLASYLAYRRLRNLGITAWDEAVGADIEHAPGGVFRSGWSVAVLLSPVLLLVVVFLIKA
jgi:uncharacterized RDD family membrane protein YckC